MEIQIEAMNIDPYDVNCLNGTFNLKTMVLRPHIPEDHITFLAQVEYDPDAQCPLWLDHLKKVFDGDKKTIDSFQRICGYSLTETNPEQVIFIVWGGGKNGKSTTFDIISNILGDYSASAKAESFMKMGENSDARNDLARLHRKRVVITSEPQRNSKLNESLIKSATGGDKISTRFLYQEFFEWIPQFKIFINTNHQPKIADGDEGIWRRIRMIPFTHQFDEDERDREIKDKLMAEKSGIFNWLINGYRKYIDNDLGGFRESPAILEATSAYRRREDIFQEYLDERCIIDKEMTVTKSDLYSDYIKWCDLGNDLPETQQKFGNMVHSHLATKIKDIRIKYDRGLKGIGLKNPAENTAIEKMRSKAKQERFK
jgi:putative DNA primase/helicase